jgi:hypothetical protein
MKLHGLLTAISSCVERSTSRQSLRRLFLFACAALLVGCATQGPYRSNALQCKRLCRTGHNCTDSGNANNRAGERLYAWQVGGDDAIAKLA